MIIIPMAGASSRFTIAGYKMPKYMLPLSGATVFAHCLKSFSAYYRTQHFRFILNGTHNAKEFVVNECEKLGLRDFSLIELDTLTRGQAETVSLGISGETDEPVTIFNIDTALKYQPVVQYENVDGCLDVFESDGSHWSFVEPGDNSLVLRTTEKNRISSLCSNGLYYFGSGLLFREAYAAYYGADSDVEHYIAPIYNYLISLGLVVKYRLVRKSDVIICGTPEEYETLLE